MSQYQLSNWPRCSKPPLQSGQIRSHYKDFQVEELLPFALSGEGEHLWLEIRKSQQTTNYVASSLAKWAGVKRMSVGFGGMKDKHAITTQWFSIQLPGKAAPEAAFDLAGCELLQSDRHTQKLRRGALKKNHFKIILRQIEGDRQEMENKLSEIINRGVPNYFTEQRFGRSGDNVARAAAYFRGDIRVKGREQRSILLSSARSWIFNQILATRVSNENWDKALPGDIFMLSGSQSVFPYDINDEAIPERLKSGDIQPTAAMPGSGDALVSAEVAKIEDAVFKNYPELIAGLKQANVKAARRSLRVIPENLSSEWIDAASLSLSFALPSGSYATAVLRELVDYTDVSREG